MIDRTARDVAWYLEQAKLLLWNAEELELYNKVLEIQIEVEKDKQP